MKALNDTWKQHYGIDSVHSSSDLFWDLLDIFQPMRLARLATWKCYGFQPSWPWFDSGFHILDIQRFWAQHIKAHPLQANQLIRICAINSNVYFLSMLFFKTPLSVSKWRARQILVQAAHPCGGVQPDCEERGSTGQARIPWINFSRSGSRESNSDSSGWKSKIGLVEILQGGRVFYASILEDPNSFLGSHTSRDFFR